MTDDQDALTGVVLRQFRYKLFFALVLCRNAKLGALISMSILKLFFRRKSYAILGADGFSDIAATFKHLPRDITSAYRFSYSYRDL